ncbi:hypothetical protein AMIS_20010 [Actinoplanes missouriensis 431]|uniref:Uncharacterized protein n=1 Tax=Actinoplanes missouriensis (strain ATCC 14538 / DSM 43046 / CBS 188.64 / JCM 3121 / NBRC 102363 / NCIMB 12654 / NRRL B-3342 / UNCC 431) TaxID=512565 RepID=I0H2I4_ACTM4|nr:hypothetical protein [Actinoplanes missouriensis]BAL87221.1 hypothetical protein AMIS_20010 [Actinoplanes missouriensis 431]
MSSESLRRQDASGHMPLGVFTPDGQLVALVPAGADYQSDQGRSGLLAAAAAEIGVAAGSLEILACCHLHPTSAAVDCLDCEPVTAAPCGTCGLKSWDAPDLEPGEFVCACNEPIDEET